MASTYTAAPPGVVVIDIEDTVTIHLPDDVTQRITPPHRRPAADPSRFEDRRSFSGIDRVTGENPLLGVPQCDPEQVKFDRFYAATGDPNYVGRHHRPSLLARLFRRGR